MKKVFTLFLISASIAACNMNGKENKTDDRVAKNKEVMQKFYDNMWNKHNVAYFDSCASPDFVEHCVDPSVPATRDGDKKLFAETFAAMPDVHMQVNFMTADSNYVVTQYTFTATNTGPMMGMPANGKKINIQGVDISRFVNGKQVEHWGYNEEMKMAMQMGMIPSMGGDSTKTK